MNTREITIIDKLKQRACGHEGKRFENCLRKITLNWDGRQEPEKAYMQIGQRFYEVSVWKKDDGTPESYEDVLLEAETNGLNAGFQEERQEYRDNLGISVEAKSE
jgi:hypothetical protein